MENPRVNRVFTSKSDVINLKVKHLNNFEEIISNKVELETRKG